ncbi:helix-turn-helix domain-containing protein [Pseudonocardia sp. HH130630-07]|uniref:helix-turn-helix domain-containing protein n=1 Tax=Pseudonocardia sp. HH130630-07 TaxID=1690815 RepID=UPI000815021E|nr:helix-turn-helix domain-containing protein [Pseudonocardia sp. HH130630-07]ANY05316.1 XRE family transcriptional regulator [Pseudonocardia sp. HH130630-07]
MRGAGDEMQIGERIAFHRQRRGYTRSQLAGLVGRSTDWLSKIERGDRQIRRVDLLTEIAGALRVTLGALMGEPALPEDGEERDDVPAVRDALMAPGRLSRLLFAETAATPSPDLQRSEQLVEFLWADYQRGRIGQVVEHLPRLIRGAQRLEGVAPDAVGDDRRRSWAVSARIHHLAATTLSKVGEADLSWIAAERAMTAADEADDPLVLASAARAATHALLAVGRYDDALSLGETASRWLDPQVAAGDPNAVSLLGMLYLRTAVAAARRQDRRSANELLGLAERSAARLGADANHWQTGFGPTNVELHRLSAGLDLGDVAWVAQRGRTVDVAHLPIERQVTHMIDVARALAALTRDDDAVSLFLEAEQAAPALVRHSAVVRATARTLYRRAPVTAGSRSSRLLGLAQRCRAIR